MGIQYPNMGVWCGVVVDPATASHAATDDMVNDNELKNQEQLPSFSTWLLAENGARCPALDV